MRQLPFQYAFRNLGRSRVRLIASLIGSTLVVMLILAAGGFVRGMQQTLTQSEPLNENIMLIGTGSEEGVERSQIDSSVTGIASASIKGIKQRDGVMFVSPEIHAALPVRLSADDPNEYQSVMRGFRNEALLVHPEVEITRGRAPQQGAEEIMIGKLASTRLGIDEEQLALGKSIYFDHRDWTIVGEFSAPNTVMNAEIWIPLTELQIATNRTSSLSCVILTLEDGTFANADLFAKSRLDLEVSAIREQEYYATIAAFFAPIRIMIIVTASLISMGGVIGGLNTMYAAFAARVREVGMLQSLGYTRIAIILNLIEESVFISICGALIGSLLGLTILNGIAVRFSMGAFTLSIDPPVLLTGLLGGLVVGFIGAIPPAIQCLRLPIPSALKSHS